MNKGHKKRKEEVSHSTELLEPSASWRRQGGLRIMNKEHKIMNEEVGIRTMTEVSTQRTVLLKAPLGVWGRAREMFGASFIAVGFSQRTGEANSLGLQPHILKMWLKPILLLFSIRWLKPTAIKNFNSFLYNNRNVPQPSFGGQGGFSPYQTNRQLGLSADKLFNN